MTMVCIYMHLPYWQFEKKITSLNLVTLLPQIRRPIFLLSTYLGRKTVDLGHFSRHFRGPVGKPVDRNRRNCLQLKHQVADLERETVRAREERKEELTSVRKRMERHGGHWFIKGWMWFIKVHHTIIESFGLFIELLEHCLTSWFVKKAEVTSSSCVW